MVYYHHTDYLGTTEVVTDESGNVVWEAGYEAFGSVLSEHGESKFTPSYTGKFFDKASGLYYFNARWYDSEIGRFITEDPARDGIDWYVYCNNNPLRFLDSTGLYDEENGYTEKEQNTFAKMSGTEQLIYLKTEYKSVTEGTSLYGLKAAHMRNQLKGLMRLDDLFYGIDGDEVFMNETLREFLNTSETGENIYRIGDMKEENGWYKMSELGSKEHQKITIDNLPNVKYVNIDGREAVFDGYDNFVTNEFDKATFNYGESLRISIGKFKTVLYGFTSDSTHGLYDMAPYFRQMNKKPDYWISVPYNYLPYGWQKTIRGEEW